MKELLFESTADAAMTALERDATRVQLLERTNAALRALASASGDARCRRHQYPGGMWGMDVRTRTDDWLILWLPGPGENQVTVLYVGPKP